MVANIEDLGVLPRLLTLGRHAEAPIRKEAQGSFAGPGGGKVDIGVVFSLSKEGLAMSRSAINEAGQSRRLRSSTVNSIKSMPVRFGRERSQVPRGGE